MKSLFLLITRRWLSAAWSLLVAAHVAYAGGGARAAVFELKVRALALHSLTVGAPLIFNELVASMTERENLLAAYRRGVSPEHYVRTKCEALGVAAGSPSYSAVLAWAWSVVNFVESKESN
ncbi:MAG: hypothetical protein ACJ74Q_21445 [Pyrinomonadaceae bacterium]